MSCSEICTNDMCANGPGQNCSNHFCGRRYRFTIDMTSGLIGEACVGIITTILFIAILLSTMAVFRREVAYLTRSVARPVVVLAKVDF